MKKSIIIPENTDLNQLVNQPNNPTPEKELPNFDDDTFLFDESIYRNLPDLIRPFFVAIDKPRNKDISLLTMLTIFSGVVKNYQSIHDQRLMESQLYFYLLANPGHGKSIAADLRSLGTPLHNYRLKRFEAEFEEYKSALKNIKNGDDLPPKPKRRFLFLSGDITKSALVKDLYDNGGYGIMLLTEADTLNNSLHSQHGAFRDLLKNGFEGHSHSVSRTQYESGPIEIESVALSLILTSTLNQCIGLLPSSEDGLFSRFAYYVIPPDENFDNVFVRKDLSDFNYAKQTIAAKFMVIGIKSEKQPLVQFEFTSSQADEMHSFFAEKKLSFSEHHHKILLGSVNRMAVIFRKITMLLGFLRCWHNRSTAMPEIITCSEADFIIGKSIINTLFQHLTFVVYMYNQSSIAQKKLSFIPSNEDIDPELKKENLQQKIDAVAMRKKGFSYRNISYAIFGTRNKSGTVKKWVERNKIKPFPIPMETETGSSTSPKKKF